MNTYKPEDFSPIHGPDTKPSKKGWYPQDIGEISCLKNAHETGIIPIPGRVGNLGYWDGKSWFFHGGGECGVQKRSWFGLNQKPQIK